MDSYSEIAIYLKSFNIFMVKIEDNLKREEERDKEKEKGRENRSLIVLGYFSIFKCFGSWNENELTFNKPNLNINS